jgi:tetratricopeptide (TPR) repeat protein
VIIAAGAVAYSNSLHGPFVFDDVSFSRDPGIRDLRRLDRILLPDKARPYYRPTVTLSLALCHRIGGLEVVPYHVFNLGIHILATLTLFGLVRRTLSLPRLQPYSTGAATALALSVSLLWMLYPLQTQSVTYIIQRCESLMGLFCLLTLYAVTRGAGSARAWWWYGGAVAACVLGMGAKEVMAMVPVLVLMYDRVFLASSWGEVFRKRWGLYLALALSCGLLVPMLRTGQDAFSRTPPPTMWEYARTQPGVVLHYLRLSFWPDALCLDHGWPVARSAREIVPPAIVMGSLFVGAVWALWRWPSWGFLGASSFLMLAPSSSFIPIPDLAFEHRMYLPLAALVALLVLGGWEAGRRLASRGVISWGMAKVGGGCLVAAASLVLGIRTYLRNADYRTDLGLWQDTVAKAPSSPGAHTGLGDALVDRGRVDEAIAHYRRALQIQPTCAVAHHNLGLALIQQDCVDEAIVHYRKALQIQPSLEVAHSNLANALVRQGRVEEAIAHYRKALELCPHYAVAHNNLGNALFQQGQVDDAIAHCQESLRLDPTNAEAHNNLGNALFRQRRVQEAAQHYQRALELKPDLPQAHSNLGLALIQQGRVDEAIAHYQQALQLAPNYFEAHCNLGLALQQEGKDQAAVQHWREALRLQPKQVLILRQIAWMLATSRDTSVRNGAEAIGLADRAIQLAGVRTPPLLDVLAAAYAEAGRFTDAVQTAQEALQMVSGQHPTPLADGLRERIRLYQAGSAFRESRPDAARERKAK